MKKFIFIFIVSSISLIAGKYGEHKFIGDSAFHATIEKMNVSNLFLFDSTNELSIFEIRKRGIVFSPFKNSNGMDLNITYGMLTGLSADHSFSPTRLIDGLYTPYSKLISSMQEHSKHINDYKSAAPDSKLADIDFEYVSLSIEDLSHFYDASKSLNEHYELKHEYLYVIKKITNFNNKTNNKDSLINFLFEELNDVNAIQKYVYLHIMALEFAIQSNLAINKTKKRNLIIYSFILNAFADHYIQDAFAAGHIPAVRSIITSLANRATHNYFNYIGLEVINLNGEAWTSYGDIFMNKILFNLNNIEENYTGVSKNMSLAIKANIESISDLLSIYKNQIKASLIDIMIEVLSNSDSMGNRNILTNRFRSLMYIPIPLSTPESQISKQLKNEESEYNQIYNRSYKYFSHYTTHDFFNRFRVFLGANLLKPARNSNNEYISVGLRTEFTAFNLYDPTTYDAKNNYINSMSLWGGFNIGLSKTLSNNKDEAEVAFLDKDRYSLEVGAYLKLNTQMDLDILNLLLDNIYAINATYVNDLQQNSNQNYLCLSLKTYSNLLGNTLSFNYSFDLNRGTDFNMFSVGVSIPIIKF